MNDLTTALVPQLAAIPTVDAHEHLHSEEMRVGRRVDVFLLFYQYLAAQLICAGMDPARVADLEKEDVPLDQK